MIIAARTYTHTHKRTISYVVTMGEREGGVNGYKKSRQQNRNVRFRKKKKGAWVHVCNAIEVTRKIRTREREKLRSRRNKWGGGENKKLKHPAGLRRPVGARWLAMECFFFLTFILFHFYFLKISQHLFFGNIWIPHFWISFFLFFFFTHHTWKEEGEKL